MRTQFKFLFDALRFNKVSILAIFISALLVQVGIFSTRWNVVIGGQLFSKSLRGLTTYKLDIFGIEGLLVSIVLLLAPVGILYVLTKVLPPWEAGDSIQEEIDKMPQAATDSM